MIAVFAIDHFNDLPPPPAVCPWAFSAHPALTGAYSEIGVTRAGYRRVVHQRGELVDIWPATSFRKSPDERKRNVVGRCVERPQAGNNWSPRPLTFLSAQLLSNEPRLSQCANDFVHRASQRNEKPLCKAADRVVSKRFVNPALCEENSHTGHVSWSFAHPVKFCRNTCPL